MTSSASLDTLGGINRMYTPKVALKTLKNNGSCSFKKIDLFGIYKDWISHPYKGHYKLLFIISQHEKSEELVKFPPVVRSIPAPINSIYLLIPIDYII